MGTESNLIVDVDELKECASDICVTCQSLDEIIVTLVQHLQTASATGLESGLAAESFIAFVEQISRLNGKLNDTGTSIKSAILDFIQDVDDEDNLLFNKTNYKEYTDDNFDDCFGVVEKTVSPSIETLDISIWNWVLSCIRALLKLEDMEVTVKMDSKILEKKVDELKKESADKIATIKAGVRSADRVGHQALKNYLDVLKMYEQVLRQIQIILSPGTSGIDATGLTILSNFLDQHEEFSNVPIVVTDEDVKYFADNVTGYFASSTTVIAAICKESLGQLVTIDFDVYRRTVKSALEYFNSYSSHYVESRVQYEKYKGEFDKMLELYNKYGSKWVDYYDGDKENAEMFNKLVKKTGDVSKDADDYVDIWFQLFCDMSESKEAFARFKANCDLNDEEVRKALERVEALYGNEVDAYVFETIEHIAQEVKKETISKGAEAVAKAYAKIVPGGGMEQIMTKVTSSILDRAFAEAPAVAQHDWVLATQCSFNKAVANLKAADPGSEGYDVLVQTVREAFDCAKQARIKFFTTMAENASGHQKSFYELNVESLKTMSLDDVTPHNAISEDEFYGIKGGVVEHILDGDVQITP